MNVRASLQDQDLGERAHDISFNNDALYFSVATDDGFKTYKSRTCDLKLSTRIAGGTCLTRVVEQTSGVALVSRSQLNKLDLYNTSEGQATGSIALARGQVILGAQITLSHIAIATATQVHLYSYGESSITKIAAYDTCRNPVGLCVLGKTVCVFPGRSQGQIQIVRLPDPPASSKLHVSIVPAHTGALRALCLSPEEDAVASASTTGTLIRLHSTITNFRLVEFRRGISPTTIYSLAISPTGNYLAATAATQTLHVFSLPSAPQPGGAEEADSSDDRGWTAVEHTSSPPAAGTPGASAGWFGFRKWGGLARVPYAPRVFRDVYSVASTGFEPGVEVVRQYEGPRTGVVGWVSDEEVVVLSAGIDARYERFRLAWNDSGTAGLRRVGWSRFLRPN